MALKILILTLLASHAGSNPIENWMFRKRLPRNIRQTPESRLQNLSSVALPSTFCATVTKEQANEVNRSKVLPFVQLGQISTSALMSSSVSPECCIDEKANGHSLHSHVTALTKKCSKEPFSRDPMNPTMTCDQKCLLQSMMTKFGEPLPDVSPTLLLDHKISSRTAVIQYCQAVDMSVDCMRNCSKYAPDKRQSHFAATVQFLCRGHITDFLNSQICAQQFAATVQYSCQPACGSNASFISASLQLQTAFDTHNVKAQRAAMATMCDYAACNIRCETDTMAHLCDQTAAAFRRQFTQFTFASLRELAESMNLTGDYYPKECAQLAETRFLSPHVLPSSDQQASNPDKASRTAKPQDSLARRETSQGSHAPQNDRATAKEQTSNHRRRHKPKKPKPDAKPKPTEQWTLRLTTLPPKHLAEQEQRVQKSTVVNFSNKGINFRVFGSDSLLFTVITSFCWIIAMR